MLGWIVALLITIPDGMVWSELGASMPGSGGSYPLLARGLWPRNLCTAYGFSLHLAVHPQWAAGDSIGLYRLRAVHRLYSGRDQRARGPLLVAVALGSST